MNGQNENKWEQLSRTIDSLWCASATIEVLKRVGAARLEGVKLFYLFSTFFLHLANTNKSHGLQKQKRVLRPAPSILYLPQSAALSAVALYPPQVG